MNLSGLSGRSLDVSTALLGLFLAFSENPKDFLRTFIRFVKDFLKTIELVPDFH